MGRSLAFASAGFLSFAAAAQGIRGAISAASDLTEEINKSSVVFRGNVRQVMAWSKSLIPAFGLTRAEALKTLSTFGNMLVPMGFVRKQAAQMSERLVELAGDLASFNNASPEDTLRALQAGLANQPRPLRMFGVFLTQARIAAEALSSGIVKANVNMGKVADAQTKISIAQAKLSAARKKYGANSIEAASAEVTLHNAERALGSVLGGNAPKLTNAQRTLAIYRIILKDTADAHGDAARTGKEWAGQMRSLHALAGGLQEELGRLLLPTMREYAGQLIDFLRNSKNQKSIIDGVKGALDGFGAAISAATALLKPLVSGAGDVARAVGGWKNALILATGAWAGFRLAGVASAIAVSSANLVAAGVTSSAWKAALISTGWGAFAVAAGVAAAYILTHYNDLWLRLRRGSLLALRDLLQPWSRLPSFLGGWARDAKIRVNEQLAELSSGAADYGTAAGSHWGVAFVHAARAAMPAGALGEIIAVAAGPPGSKGPVGSRGEPIQGRGDFPRKKGGDSALAQSQAEVDRLNKMVNQQRKFSGSAGGLELPFKLQLQQAQAEAENNLKAILAVARAIRAWVLRLIPKLHGQKLLDAYSLLGQANDTIASAAKEAADKAKQQAEDAKRKLQEARDKMNQAIESVRQQIGELFQGPILQPTEQQTKARLGVPGPKATDLTKDLRAQTALFARFNRDLAILSKRGASPELIKELRAKGPSALPEVEALAKANRATLNAFFRAFRQREKLVQRVALVEMRATNVEIKAAKLTIGGKIPHMGTGGIVNTPTLAVIGDKGREAVIPMPSSMTLPRLTPPRVPMHTGGAEHVVIENYLTVEIDGHPVEATVTKRQQRRRTSTASQVRGRYSGISDAG
jgi:hypothetical protein